MASEASKTGDEDIKQAGSPASLPISEESREVAQWLAAQQPPYVWDVPAVCAEAVRGGHMASLQWLIAQRKPFPDREFIAKLCDLAALIAPPVAADTVAATAPAPVVEEVKTPIEQIKLNHHWFKHIKLAWNPETEVRTWTSSEMANGETVFEDVKLVLNPLDLDLCFSVLSTQNDLPEAFVRSVLTSRIPPGTKIFHRGEEDKDAKLKYGLYADFFDHIGTGDRDEMAYSHPLTGKKLRGHPDSVMLTLKAEDGNIHYEYNR